MVKIHAVLYDKYATKQLTNYFLYFTLHVTNETVHLYTVYNAECGQMLPNGASRTLHVSLQRACNLTQH